MGIPPYLSFHAAIRSRACSDTYIINESEPKRKVSFHKAPGDAFLLEKPKRMSKPSSSLLMDKA